MSEIFSGLKIGFAMTGSFCTFAKCFEQAEILKNMGAEIIPIMSENASGTSTRFGTADENIKKLSEIAGRDVIMSITDAEPIGPKNMTDIMIVAPCTSNTASKLANSITDTSVIMNCHKIIYKITLCNNKFTVFISVQPVFLF
ncbi:MAG: hypothetical protein K2J36_03805 [Ruminococcus sp.]|nr:hypothetical protein [Ruminococcus sp.]